MTKVEMFNAIANLDEVKANEEMTKFIAHEIELLNKKKNSPKKPSKTKVENDGYKAEIVAFLSSIDKPVTIKEIQGGVPSVAELSNQRITHMLTDLRNDGVVKRTYEKKVPYFTLGNENEDATE